MTMASPRYGRQQADSGSFYVGGVEVRTVPSRTFPDLATALSNLGNGSSVSPPNVVVRLLTGNFECDRLYINNPVVIEGDGKGLPTIRCVGADGLRIVGRAATGCALRRLRICADAGMPAVTVQDASPVIDGCELLGSGGEIHRGSPPGLLVKGQKSRPIIRGCLISGHAGPGVIFKADAGGVLAHCEVSKCGCGVWLEEGGNPLLWRNTISGQRGAGLVVKADGSGSAVGNSILQNGAAGMLIESSRCLVTAMVKNRVWENRVQDLRQSPAPSGHTAAESGTILLNNHIGKRDDNSGNGGNDPSSTMISVWPRRSARDAAELKSAIADAPRDRTVLIEVIGSIELEERLIIDRPIVLVGSGPGSAEIRGGPGSEATICVVRGGEASAFRWLTLRLQGGGGSITRAAGSCVDVRAGRPTFLECDFNAAVQQVDGRHSGVSSERTRLTHAVRVAGEGVSPVFAGCILRGASSVGLVIDGQASACLVQCELSRNRQGGSFLGRAASLVAESCKICGNGHFGVVVGPRATFVYIGNSTVIGNVAGSMWHCGHSTDMADESDLRSVSSRDPPPLIWMDHCTLAGPGLHSGSSSSSIGSGGPAVVIGPGAGAVLWESFLLHQTSSRKKNGHEVNGSSIAELNGGNGSSGGKLMLVRVEATARVAIASNGPIGGWPGWAGASAEKSGVITGIPSLISGVGTAVMLDISGAGPPTPPPLPEPQIQALARPSYSEHLWRAWEAPPPPPPPPGMPVSPMPGYAAPPTPPVQQCARAKTAPAHHPSSRPSAGARSTPASPVMPEASAARDRRGGSKPIPLQPAQPPAPATDTQPAVPEDKKPASSPDIDARVMKLMSLQGSIKIYPGESSMDDDHRTTLYEVLAMLVVKYKCKDSLMSAGLGGPLRPDDAAFFRGHTGRWAVVKDGKVQCNASDRESATSFRLKSVGAVENGVFNTGNTVSLVALGPDGSPTQQLGVVPPAGEIKPVSENSAESQFIFDVESGKKAYSGMPVFLKGKGSQKNIDVKGDTVNARFADRGTLQRIVLERMVPESKLPPPCPDKSFTDLEVSWLFLRGAQHGLIDRQFLAAALSSHKGPAKDLLIIYTKLWWEECKSTLPPQLFGKGGAGAGKRGRAASDASGSSRRSKSPSAWLRDKLSGGGGSSVDNSNAELFMAGLRSYFLRAVRMSQLEADCVQRVIEAFANELAGDSDFMGTFNHSMKPKPERKVYKEDEECLFGLTYMVVILNTDAHNSQVAERVMDYKKFVAAGQKNCGVTGGLMSAIYKLVEAEEL